MRWWGLVGWLVVGCAKQPVDASKPDIIAGQAEADAQWEQRADERQLVAALGRYRVISAEHPSNRHALQRLTRGHYFHATAFPATSADVVRERLTQAQGFGEACLFLNPEIRAEVEEGERLRVAVQHATNADVPCLYWTAETIARRMELEGLSRSIKHLPTIKSLMEKVSELDPTYFHQGPARFWGWFYAAMPSFAGQDLDRSTAESAQAVDQAPHYLPNWYERARTLHTKAGNATQFSQDLMNAVISAPDQVPAVTPENVRTQRMARELLLQRDQYFTKQALRAAGPLGTVPQPTPPGVRSTDGTATIRTEQTKAFAPEFPDPSDLDQQLTAQACQQTADRLAREHRKAKLDEAVTATQDHARTTWTKLMEQRDRCLSLSDRSACIKAVGTWLSTAEAAVVILQEGNSVVQTDCGAISIDSPAVKRQVKIAEIAAARRFLTELRGSEPTGTVRHAANHDDIPQWLFQVIDAALPRMKACYQDGLQRNPSLSGDVSLRFTVTPEGAVTKQEVEATTLRDPAVETCVQREMGALTFAPPTEQPVQVVYPLGFRPQ